MDEIISALVNWFYERIEPDGSREENKEPIYFFHFYFLFFLSFHRLLLCERVVENEEEVSVRGKVMRCSFHCVFERVEAVIHHRFSTVNDNDIQKRMAIAFNVFNVGRIETLLI